jgi:hypothetical protein
MPSPTFANSSCPGGSTLTGTCISFTVGPCSPNCPNPTQGQPWAFSQIMPGTAAVPLSVFESSGQMVFGADGAFSSWMALYISDQNFLGIAKSVARNINEALNRGLASCNNLTMSNPTATCRNMTPSLLTGFTPPSGCTLSAPAAPNCPSDAWWANEHNWYPAGGGTQNYYSQYLHTGQLTGNYVNGSACTQYSIPSASGVQNTAVNQCANIVSPPNFYLATPPSGCSTPNGWSPSAQGVPMGTAYGFSYDENPTYLVAQPAQVPSKFDPLPSCWPLITSFSMVIGRTLPLAAHDFNGDSMSDIAWRNTNGDTSIWLMNGAQVLSTGDLGLVPNSWVIVGQRDFNGDGNADLLWQNINGDTSIWLMNGTQVSSATDLGIVGNGWVIVGTGDFNGDGKGDILWRNSNGDTAIWLMNGTQVLLAGDLGGVPVSWSVAQTGDFNGDGYSDILWHNTNGDTSIWLMNGTQILSATDLGAVPPSWNIAGAGDFNGDGMSDILWRNTNGDTSIWLMNGTQVSSAGDLGLVPTSWMIAVTGDFNGDGKSDILWSNTNGDTSIWFMNGTQVSSAVDLGIVPSSWVVQGAGAD